MPQPRPRPIRVKDRVKWDDPDEGRCSGTGTVVKLFGYDSCRLRMDDGGENDVPIHELTVLEEGK
jgi:hypothetical protein